ncbi:MAG: cytochrome c family protein [bacterium]|nr:cytochrome c family protein [bacterium]
MKNLVRAAVSVGIILVLVLYWWRQNQWNTGYQPTQPIAFSHKLHVQGNKIDCMYCHVGVERSAHATIPPVSVCMNCHSIVRTDRPAIQKLTELYNSGKPVEWVRIHRLPDHAYFSHKWHIAKGFACVECHGQIEQMDVVQQAKRLEMGDCVSCHRQNNAPTSCNTCHQ